MKNAVFWDIKTQFVLHRRHITFLLESNQSMLCKIWGFHGGDYEECRLLGYKNPVRTSQETHYVSTTETSQLMLCKIWGVRGGDYEECRLLGYKNSPYLAGDTLHLCYRAQPCYVRFEVFTAVTMNNAVFCDVTPCGSCKNRHFGGTYRLHYQGDKNGWSRNNVSRN
jgi:hypothetical protein